MIEWHRALPAPAAGIGVELIRVPEGSLVDVELRLESVCEGVLATGTVHAALVGECARCLTEIAGERDFEFQELFCYPGRDTDEDALHIVDDHIDIEQPMRDAIVLELPFTPLCRPDCPGPSTDCELVLADDPEPPWAMDPRWAGLKGLLTEQSRRDD